MTIITLVRKAAEEMVNIRDTTKDEVPGDNYPSFVIYRHSTESEDAR